MNLLHALFTRNLLMSGAAIVRYIPRALRVKQVDGNLFFTEEKRQEYHRHVESVTPHSPRQWGTMEVDQMLHHLNLACGGSLGFYNLPDEQRHRPWAGLNESVTRAQPTGRSGATSPQMNVDAENKGLAKCHRLELRAQPHKRSITKKQDSN